jgi:anti-sigma factor RsiW
MNNQEAKLILRAYRPEGEDASDPMFAEALEQARRDPELQKWLAEETAVDAQVQARLRTAIPIPRDLKSNLLAQRKIVRPAPWWIQRLKLAAAAAVLLVGIFAFRLLSQKPAPLASFREAMARYSTRGHGHVVFESHDIAKVRQWLQDRAMPANFELPAALPPGTTHGCRVVDWNGRKATMLCFVLDDGEHLDLFVVDHAGLPDVPENSAPQYAEAGGLATAAWSKDGRTYLLTASDKKHLQKLLLQT